MRPSLRPLLLVALLMVACNGQDTAPAGKSAPHDASSPSTNGTTVPEMSKSILCVFQDRAGAYWFGSDGQGVYRHDGKTITQFTTKDGLSGDQVRGFQEDKSGNVYVATGMCCVSKFDGRTIVTLSAPATVSPMTEWSLQPDDLWFPGGQDTGTVLRYDGKVLHRLAFPRTNLGDEFIAGMPRDKYPNAKYSPYDVYTVHKDRKGNVWFGTAVLGACRYDGRSFDWINRRELEIAANFGVRSIVEDKDGKFWFSDIWSRWDIYPNDSVASDNRVSKFRKERGTEVKGGRAVLDHFMSALKDGNGDLWMASYGAGVWRYDGTSMTHYPVMDGPAPVTLYSIYRDRQGALWVGTHAAGAYKFNGKTFEKFKP